MSRFATGLRAAIEAGSLSLEELSAALADRGAKVSPSSLSAWQSGLSVPRRRASVHALAELEHVLGLARGSLSGLIPPSGGARPVPTLAASDAWENPGAVSRVLSRLGAVLDDPTDPEKLSQRLTLRVDERGHMRSLGMSTLIRARRDRTDRLISVSSDDEIQDAPRVITARGAEIGRFRGDPPTGYSAYEILLSSPVDHGRAALVEYTEYFQQGVDGTDLSIRMHPGSQDAVLTVEFHPDRLPVECWGFHQPSTRQKPVRLVTFEPGREWVRLVRWEPPPGIYGIGWDWG